MVFAAYARGAGGGYLTVQPKDLPGNVGHSERVERVHGLFVGVSRYENPAYAFLANAAGDATALAESFDARCGLATKRVLTNEQATHAAIRAALSEIAAAAGPEDLFVFHFSGHGVGLLSKEGKTLKGLLLLRGAPPLADLWRGDFGDEVIDLDLLENEWEGKGLRAKHRFVILDSCYGGIAAYPRIVSRLMTPGDVTSYEIARPATYVLSGGGALQEVLDGRAEGRGLLTGELIGLLSREPANVEIGGGKIYLAMRPLFDVVARGVNAEARAIRNPERAALTGNRSVGVSAKDPQVPRQAVRRGEGHIFLPLKRTDAIALPPAPEASPSPGTPAPNARGAASASALGEWAAETELARTNEAYATAWRDLTRLLAVGPTTPASGIEVAVEPLMRVSAGPLQAALHRAAAGSLAEDEAMREGVPGAEWMRVAEIATTVTTAHEVGFTFYNLGAAPAYFYLVAVDDGGRVQLLVGGNEADACLKSRAVMARPQAREGEREWPLGWKFDDAGGEQAYLAIATAAPWPELASILKTLEAKSEGATRARHEGLGASLPKWLGTVTGARLRPALTGTQQLPRDVTPFTLRSAGGWLGVTWCWPVVEGEAKLAQAP